MKFIIAPLLAVLILFQGCSTLQNYNTPTAAGTAAALVTANALVFVSDANRAQVANYVYGIAQGVRTLSGGQVPTVAEFQAMVAAFTKNAPDAKWATLGTSLAAIWGGIYPNVQGNPKVALQYLEAIAEGCETAAKPYLAPTS